jgi:hypothetical protein
VPLVDEISYGLPSGHAQVPLAIWGYVVWVWRETSRWLLLLVILFVALIGFGRIYLGVHFVADTVVGLIVGLLTLILWLIYQPGIEERIRRLSARQQLLLAIAVPLLLLVLVGADPLGYPSEDSATITGVMLGMSVGFYYETRRLRFKTEGSGFQKVLRYLVGIVMVLFVWGGLRVLFGMVDASHPIEIALRFIRYSLTACVVAWWAPAVFVRLGLAEQEKSAMVG